MTHIPTEDDLSARITGTLRQRAGRVAVDDRLDRVTGPTEPVRLIGGFAPRSDSQREQRRPIAARLVFAAAAVLVAVALTLTLWQRAEQEPLAPVTGPTADARIFPAIDPLALESIGLGPQAGVVIARDTITMTGPALMLGRPDGDRLADLVAVTVNAEPDPGAGDTPADPVHPLDGIVSGQAAVTRTVGGRTVRVPVGLEGEADLVVWLGPDASQADIDALQALLEDALLVRSFTYLNREATWDSFQQYYADQPEVLDLVDADQLPTSFRLQLEAVDQTVVASFRAELLAMPGVNQVSLGVALTRYEWDEGGATIIVDLGPDSELPVDAVIAALTVSPRPAGPPEVSVEGPLPGGLVIVAGPSGPIEEPLPWLNVSYADGNSHIMVTAQPALDPRYVHTRVTVGGRDAYLSEHDGGITLTWPIDDQGWWAQLVGHGLTNGQALALAAAVTFTDEATWTARYPAQPATTFEAGPVTTIATITNTGGAGAGPAATVSPEPGATVSGVVSTTFLVPPGAGATVDSPATTTTTGP